jgi:SAM-dependent methyltransferase
LPDSTDLYDHPRYYDLGFSFRDIPAEVDVLEEAFRRYSKIPVRRVLELSCGVAPHLEELARRGYEYAGLDINPNMIAYVAERAESSGTRPRLERGDMRDFALSYEVDFAFIMCGSLYVQSTSEMLRHLTNVARVLRPGGLYFLDWCINFEWCAAPRTDQAWTIERDGVKLSVVFKLEIVDRAEQLARHVLRADVDDRGEKLVLESTDVVRVILPQEFLLLIDKSQAFEFIGWWNNWDFSKPIRKVEPIDRPIAIVRRV